MAIMALINPAPGDQQAQEPLDARLDDLRDEHVLDGIDDYFLQVAELVFEEFPDTVDSFCGKGLEDLIR